MRKFITFSAFLLTALCVFADALFECEFAPGKWDRTDFLCVKSSRWENINAFEQESDHIVNSCPKDATKEEMLSKRAPETYAAMIYVKPLTGNHVITSKMSFDYRMAPSIVLAETPDKSPAGYPEFRTHYEIVLYDGGINVWRHWFADGKQVWRKAAFLKAKFEPGKEYELTVSVAYTQRGPVLTVSCGDCSFGFIDDLFPQEYYAGIVAAEGVNRFYDFKIK